MLEQKHFDCIWTSDHCHVHSIVLYILDLLRFTVTGAQVVSSFSEVDFVTVFNGLLYQCAAVLTNLW